jgi:hypothetical protein
MKTETNKNDRENTPKRAANRSNWRRVHHSPLFWIGVFLFLAAGAIYVLSNDLSWRPHIR